jgi:hypothetical protein
MNPHTDSTPDPDAMRAARAHPESIIRGHLIGARDGGHWIFTKPHWDDRFDLTSGECRMARVIGGLRYDTAASVLVARHSGIDVYGLFHFRWLFLANHGAWFTVHIDGQVEQFRETASDLRLVPTQSVLQVARLMIEPGDCLRFLTEWYGGGWIPRDDDEARSWAEEILPADDCERVLGAIARKPV